MDAWIETVEVVLLALLGVAAGRWFSTWRKPFWVLGYAIPMVFVLTIGATRIWSRLEFAPPFAWVLAGRTEFALGALMVTMLLTTPLSRLPRLRDRRAVVALMLVFLSYESIWPFLAPALNRQFWMHAMTRFSGDGVCLQRDDYDCGPAAAVTALRVLGIQAEEGEIAILAHTSSALGTPPDVLAEALQQRYGRQGLVCKYRYFDSVDELKEAGPVLAVIRYGFLVDHYVTIMQVREQDPIVGDPSQGRVRYSHAAFEKKWRHTGIQMFRERRVLALAGD